MVAITDDHSTIWVALAGSEPVSVTEKTDYFYGFQTPVFRSGWRESNPRSQGGSLLPYLLATPA